MASRSHILMGSMWDLVFCSTLSVQPWRSAPVYQLRKCFCDTYCSVAILRLDWGTNPLLELCKFSPLLSSQLWPTEVSSHTQSHEMVPCVLKQMAGTQDQWRIFIMKAWHFFKFNFEFFFLMVLGPTGSWIRCWNSTYFSDSIGTVTNSLIINGSGIS